MKARSTILALAGLATLSLSALAPTQASAWGMGGYGGGYGYGGGFGGYHTMHIGGLNWGGGGYRPYYRPSFGSYPTYAPAVTYQRSYFPRRIYTAEPCNGEAPVYHSTPHYAPATYAPAPETYAPAPQTYAPAPQEYAPAPQTYAPAPQAYTQAPQTYAPAPETYAPATAPQSYAPAPQAYAPQQQQGYEATAGQPQPSQDRNRVNYSSKELQK
jgi:hypothetical protein